MDWEIERRSALMRAVQSLPNSHDLTNDDAEGKALLLYSTSEWGRNDERPHNRPSTAQKCDKDLRKLMELCAKTVAHIEQMNRPAVGAYFSEDTSNYGDLWTLKNALAQAAEIAGHGLGCEKQEASRGQRKIEAAQVTEMAGQIFEAVSGHSPTFTTDPISNTISGPWPSFLSAVFAALMVDASVESQVRAVREKSPAN
ncbi:hypothetical protein [Nioella sp.]|uniref:hypothetical protein n=1 Tax=Nioella sp. TaxID=1912091 RepID=UPI003A843D83